MSDKELWQLLDHPPKDQDAPRNPVLTTHVMDRVRDEQRTAHNVRAYHSPVPWLIFAGLVLVGLAIMPDAELAEENVLDSALTLFDPDVLLEVLIGSVVAMVLFVWSWRRLA